MSVARNNTQAVIFDYGNTLIPFGPAEIAYCDGELIRALRRMVGAVDEDVVRAVRNRDRLAPYAGDPPEWRENDLRQISQGLLRAVAGREPNPEELDALLRTRHRAFVESVRAPEYLRAFLDRLRPRFRLGLLSNYPGADALRESLERIGIADCFDAVVVSGDLGFVKPHPLLFETCLRGLGADAAAAVMVGDNWLADVQGAKRAGLRTVWLTQYDPPEEIARRGPGHEPDAIAAHLLDVEALLSRMLGPRAEGAI